MRYTRQALKQDRFAETAADAMHWTVEHRSKMINGGIAVAAILIVFLGAFWYTHHREVKATEELGQALMTYQAPLRPPAIPADPQQPSFTYPGIRFRNQRTRKYWFGRPFAAGLPENGQQRQRLNSCITHFNADLRRAGQGFRWTNYRGNRIRPCFAIEKNIRAPDMR